MLSPDYMARLTSYIPANANEEGLTADQTKVLEYLKQQVAETGMPVYVDTLINKFGSHHRRLQCNTWHGRPLQEMIDKGTVTVVKTVRKTKTP